MPLIETKGAASAQGFGEFLQQGQVNYIEDVFSTWLYTGNGTTQTITNGIDLSGKGGLVWSKARAGAQGATGHNLFDTARGRAFDLYSNLTNAQFGPSSSTQDLISFNSNGFTLGTAYNSNVNELSTTYASWTFRKQPKFFDVVTYTGNGGTQQNIPHNLQAYPGLIIVKRTDSAGNWYVCPIMQSNWNNDYLLLNSAAGKVSSVNIWQSTSGTSLTTFGVLDGSTVNISGATYVAYLFADSGSGGFGLTGSDNVISCGTFTTDGSANATITLGYEPQWVLIKPTSRADDWKIFDTMRGWISASTNSANYLLPNTSGAEGVSTYGSPNATGFTFTNASNETSIYIAIRRGPMKVPTSGTSVYKAINYAGTGTAGRSITGVGFPPDTFFTSAQEGLFGIMPNLYDRLRGGTLTLQTSSTTYEPSANNFNYTIDQDGNTIDPTYNNLNMSGKTYINWYFGRAPKFFDVVCYTGNGVQTARNHNLGVVPEFMMLKRRSFPGGDWDMSTGYGVSTYSRSALPYTAAFTTLSYGTGVTYGAAPTATTFTTSQDAGYNGSGYNYVAYLFASCPGVSKVGTYTGTGALQTINCGFTGGVRWVMIKRTDSTGDWYIYDSTRGISSSSDPYLAMNSSAAEVTGTNYVDTTSVGFQVTAAAPAGLNASGGTYLFLAIA